MDSPINYVAEGMALIKIPPRKKRPIAHGWNKRENAITDPYRASALTGNIGLAHAYSTPPTMALDVDDLPKAREWLAERGIDLDELLNADDAVQIVSGKAGRAKLLYRLPEGPLPIESLAIKEKVWNAEKAKEKTVLEFRCGTRDGLTMQDVLPPSIHPDTGMPYRWGGKGDWRAIPVIPDALLAIWLGELASRSAKHSRPKGKLSLFKTVADTPRQRAVVTDMLRHVSADCSYELYRDMVWAILSLGWQDAEAIAERWCRTAPHRFEEDDFCDVVNCHDLSRSPSYGTIHYHAREGGWNGNG